MKIAIAIGLALVAGIALAQGMRPAHSVGTYQVVPLQHGTYSAFKIDTSTGVVSFCQVTAQGAGPVDGVRCVSER